MEENDDEASRMTLTSNAAAAAAVASSPFPTGRRLTKGLSRPERGQDASSRLRAALLAASSCGRSKRAASARWPSSAARCPTTGACSCCPAAVSSSPCPIGRPAASRPARLPVKQTSGHYAAVAPLAKACLLQQRQPKTMDSGQARARRSDKFSASASGCDRWNNGASNLLQSCLNLRNANLRRPLANVSSLADANANDVAPQT